MSIDRSLKSRHALSRHRNVLTRGEQLEILADEGKWDENTQSIFGLPKVAHRKSTAGKKDKKAKELEETTGEEGASEEPETEAGA